MPSSCIKKSMMSYRSIWDLMLGTSRMHLLSTFLEDLLGPIYPRGLCLLLFNISSHLLGNMRQGPCPLWAIVPHLSSKKRKDCCKILAVFESREYLSSLLGGETP